MKNILFHQDLKCGNQQRKNLDSFMISHPTSSKTAVKVNKSSWNQIDLIYYTNNDNNLYFGTNTKNNTNKILIW